MTSRSLKRSLTHGQQVVACWHIPVRRMIPSSPSSPFIASDYSQFGFFRIRSLSSFLNQRLAICEFCVLERPHFIALCSLVFLGRL